jgi:hypothetical protein
VGFGVPVNVTAEVSVEPLVSVPVGAVVEETCGATGVSVGVAEFEADDAAEVPPLLVAVAVNV